MPNTQNKITVDAPNPMTSTYRTQSLDTTKEAELLLFQAWREMSPEDKLLLVQKTNQKGIKLALIGIKNQLPNASIRETKELYFKKRTGKTLGDILDKVSIEKGLMLDEPIGLATQLALIFEQLNIVYYISNSVASSIHGEVRFTQDLDIALYLSQEQKQPFLEAIKDEFYLNDPDFKIISSVNVINLKTVEKADLFLVNPQDEFTDSVMNRRQRIAINQPPYNLYVCSPEDIILLKLRWYNLAGNESQKQWRDILGVLKTQGNKLDFGYLWEWGEKVGVLDDLNLAFVEAEV